ncbi:hypothetical protein PYW07_009701 [Mythimna separata]|uniref:Ion transport domain-containing protein n=1 Tax=Mythimna separata TaxID=271217 RepID=A0AAD7YCT3_MYTSE|nr:hypothetical protein PYW07_009701 [Mythimna separata]
MSIRKNSESSDKNIRFSEPVYYSARNEGLLLQPAARGCDMQRAALQRPRSISLFDTLEDHQPLLKQTTSGSVEEDDMFDASYPDDRQMMPPAVTLPNNCGASRRFARLNTLLLEAVKHRDVQEIERLIKAGANPNATCGIDCVSVCHLAAMRSDDALAVLINAGAERKRLDRLGRTPLHLAAWAGNVKQIAVLLGFPAELQNRLAAEDMSIATEEEVKKLSQELQEVNVKELVNVRCDFGTTKAKLPKNWKDNAVDHNCKEFEKNLPIFQMGWSALHAASARGQARCARLLMAAGADPCAPDLVGKIPLDIAGSAYYAEQNIDANDFADLVSLLIGAACGRNTRIRDRKTVNTPLHTAVELGSLEAVSVLVAANVPVNWTNRAGQTPLHICVRKKLKDHLQMLATHGFSDKDITAVIDVKDRDGHTVLHEAILEEWGPGVTVALEAGASITATDNKRETPIHLAAMKGNVDILNEILKVAKQRNVIDITNSSRETALFKAVGNGHLNCVKRLLEEGASITKTLSREVNLFHIAAQKGNLEVLTVLLDHDYIITRRIVNYLTADDKKGYGPIHFAVENNHPKCVKRLLARNAYRSLRTSYGLLKGSTPLHIAAIHNNVEIAKIIMFNNEDTVHIVNNMGWTPLHTASHYGSREMITLLLKEGADLSCCTNGPNKCRNTAMDMIMNNLSKPTEFLEEIFNDCISTNDSNLQDPNCEVTVNYKILVPTAEEKVQMKVIDALLKTGDRYGQRRLLVHPLLESFLYLKWKALLPFFYTMLAVYAFFVLSLTTFIISVLFYKDTKDSAPLLLNSTAWEIVLYITIVLIVAQEILYLNISNGYFGQLETWVKFSSVGLAVILPYALNVPVTDMDWPRHVATGALLMSWLEMMFLLSRFPNWGYYVLMFGKVSTNVIKILLTFAFLIVGFALSFMIQFHSQIPFETPWTALVKTIVMMTSEFDYEDLVKQKNAEKFGISLLVVRIIFLTFLILASIVLMNLMVGVAVNDLHNLQVLGNVRRLGKQVEFLGSLEHLVYNRLFKKLLPNWLENVLSNKKKILNVFVLSPSLPKSKCYRSLPSHIREAIFEKAQSRKKQMDDELGSQNYKKKLDEIYRATVKIKQENLAVKHLKNKQLQNDKNNSKNVTKHLIELDQALCDIKNQTRALGYSFTQPVEYNRVLSPYSRN